MFHLPEIIEFNMEKLIANEKLPSLRVGYERFSDDYKTQCFKKDMSYVESIAYACARMPATYSAAMHVLNEFHEKVKDSHIKNVLDLGSGTGALMSAFISYGIKSEYTAVEKSINMKNISEKLIENSELRVDILNKDVFDFFKTNQKTYDSSFLIYFLNELNDKKKILHEIDKTTENFIFVIEPGTPKGFDNIKLVKEFAQNRSYSIIAPCATDQCPMKHDDWCHFSVRVPRKMRHIFIKNASLPYEDEKFSYIIVSKTHPKNFSKNRIIRRPIKKVGHTILDICTDDGIKRIFTSNKTINKKLLWGDELEILE